MEFVKGKRQAAIAKGIDSPQAQSMVGKKLKRYKKEMQQQKNNQRVYYS